MLEGLAMKEHRHSLAHDAHDDMQQDHAILTPRKSDDRVATQAQRGGDDALRFL
jgi:hypothetical protein